MTRGGKKYYHKNDVIGELKNRGDKKKEEWGEESVFGRRTVETRISDVKVYLNVFFLL